MYSPRPARDCCREERHPTSHSGIQYSFSMGSATTGSSPITSSRAAASMSNALRGRLRSLTAHLRGGWGPPLSPRDESFAGVGSARGVRSTALCLQTDALNTYRLSWIQPARVTTAVDPVDRGKDTSGEPTIENPCLEEATIASLTKTQGAAWKAAPWSVAVVGRRASCSERLPRDACRL